MDDIVSFIRDPERSLPSGAPPIPGARPWARVTRAAGL
jgi:hypothetical protein